MSVQRKNDTSISVDVLTGLDAFKVVFRSKWDRASGSTVNFQKIISKIRIAV